MRQMAHDMRGLMATLAGTSDLFLAGGYGELSPPQMKAMERVRRSSTRLQVLLDDLMAYVKAEAGEYVFDEGPFDPRQVIAHLHRRVQTVIESKGLSLRLCIDDAIPQALYGDQQAVERVLSALLWNAVACTAEGSIALASCWSPDRGWQVCVEDSGPGISEHAAPRIFEPFWREGTTAYGVPTSGCGLGLAMAAALTRSMRGTLRLEKTSPLGTLFCLELPLEAPRAPSDQCLSPIV
ncbi:MAG TPA: HAMP domain-containing sensor histidine kinase [Aggregatilineaceae bacterium]|nr:HAMP domain-containing sensor histidine kinase [Aggregatilineaceae bacterium]